MRGGLYNGKPGWLCGPSLAVCLCGGRHNWQAGRLDQGLGMSHLKDKYRHGTGWENASVQASCSALRIPAGEAKGLPCSVLLGRAATFGHKQSNGLQITRGQAAPVGREEIDVRSQWVSSTHAWRGRWSRRSEISSSGEVEIWVGTIRLGVVVLAAAAVFFLVFSVAGLGAAVGFGWGFSGLADFLVAVNLGS